MTDFDNGEGEDFDEWDDDGWNDDGWDNEFWDEETGELRDPRSLTEAESTAIAQQSSEDRMETEGPVPPSPEIGATATPFQPVSPQPAPTATPTVPETSTERQADSAQTQDSEAQVETGRADDPDATPTPLYMVVTATPTAEALVVAPTFTPWPTVTPQPEFNAVSLLNPSGQNLMIALLCLIFLTASGLGTLGLVTSVIYMRSRAQREEHLARLYGRRRY